MENVHYYYLTLTKIGMCQKFYLNPQYQTSLKSVQQFLSPFVHKDEENNFNIRSHTDANMHNDCIIFLKERVKMSTDMYIYN